MFEAGSRIPSRHPRSGWVPIWFLVLLAAGVWLYATPSYVRMFLSGQSNSSSTGVSVPGTVPGRRSGELAVVFFNVRYGDGILVQAPGNVTSLIDGGEGLYPESPEAPVYNWGYELYVPFLNTIGLTAFRNFVSTIPASHHMGVQPDLLANEKFTVENVYWTGYRARFSAHRRFRIHAKDKTNFDVLTSGDTVSFGPGVKSLVTHGLSDAKIRPRVSRVMLLKFGSKKVLLMSDLPRKDEKTLVLKWGEALDSDVLKVGKHGSDHATGNELLRSVSPKHAVISVADKNPLGAPEKSVLSNLKQVGALIHNTGKHGHVAVYTDGESLRVERNVFPFVSN